MKENCQPHAKSHVDKHTNCPCNQHSTEWIIMKDRTRLSTPIIQPTRCTRYIKLFIIVKRSTCFGRSFPPSWGAQNCVYSNGIYQTAAATCCYRGWDGTQWSFHPSSGAQNCLYSNGICQTAAATCCYRGWDGTAIIRSSKPRIQQRYMSNSCCYLLLSGMRWNSVPSDPR